MNDKTEHDDIDLEEGEVLVESLDKGKRVVTHEGEQSIAEYARRKGVAQDGVSWMDLPVEQVRDMLARRGENRTELLGWIRANLKEGVDYGIIKQKKSLWKPGAEKIAGMLGLQVHWPDLEQEIQRLRGGSSMVFLSCVLAREGAVMAQGAGARNVEDDKGDFNKAIKMCKKSAMIDAVLNVAGLSEVFTQDLEEEYDDSPLSQRSREFLQGTAEELYGERAAAVLESLARRRFQFADGDWKKIPAHRLADAIRSLEEKAEQDGGAS